MKFYCRVIIAGVSLVALQSAAMTIHRSFRPREVGVGAGASVVVPVETRVAQAIENGREIEAKKPQVVIGKCTRVPDGDTIHVVTDGNVRFKVRLNRIDAPESDQPYGKESAAYLSSLIRGKTVRVEYESKDRYGRILGIVYATVPSRSSATGAGKRGTALPSPVAEDRDGTVDINLHLVATGNAWHYSYFDKTPAYSAAEASAKEKKLGLWAAENPINPYEWRKNKRKM